MLVYLADLGHNQVTITSDVYPLGIANLAAYVLARSKCAGALEIRLFREPQDLKAALDDAPPDVIGFSSYCWNHRVSRLFARYAKARRAETLTLLGGPNYPLTLGEQQTFLEEMPEIDVAVRGPTYEGERAFLNLIDRFDEVGGAREGLYDAPIPGSVWIDRRSDSFVHGGDVERIKDLDEIPSPYLGGWMDPFFSTGYFPMMQIARGCPFSCTFCNSSVRSNNKIAAHSIENVKADLDYIAQRVRPEIMLCLADDNFGMYERDEEVADYFAHLQDTHDWPRYVRTTTGKNRGDRIIRVLRKARNALPMTAAVQSLNPEVLKNIKRDNINLETYTQIQDEVRAQGMQSYGELILCLPGETKATALQAMHDLMETGVQRVSAHQLMLLHGAPLSDPESRERFGMQTQFRVVARCLGDYTGEVVAETEELVVETSTFSFQDYLDTRVFHLLLTIYFYEGNFQEVFECVRQHDVKPFDLITRLQARLNEAPPAFQQLIADFVRENEEELFDTREACEQWVRQNYQGLLDGSVGGNLLSKYSMIGRFFVTHDTLDFLQKGATAALGDAPGLQKVASLSSVMDYLRCVVLHVPFAETIDNRPSWTTSFDVEAWREDGYAKDLNAYRFARPRSFRTFVEPDVRTLILSRVATFGEHAAGLGRFTRSMFARDLRRKLERGAATARAAAGV